MAPRFEAAEPFVPNISEAYGRSEAILRGNAPLSDAYQNAARLKTSVNEAAADRSSRSQEAGLDRAQAAAGQSAQAMGRLGAQNVEAQQNEFQRQHQQRLQIQEFQARAAAQQFEAQAELQVRAETQKLGSWLRRQEFTYADQLELQKQERQVRAIQQAVGEGAITPAEGRREALRLTSGIDALRMRQQETQTRMMDAHAKQYEAQAAMDTQVRLKNADLDSKTLQERTVTVPLPDGGTATLYQTGYDQNGRPTYTQAKSDGGSGREQQFKQAMDASGSASKQVSEMIAGRQKAELPLEDWMKTPEGVTQKTVELARAQAMAAKAYIAEMEGRGQPVQPGDAAKTLKSADPMDWKDGFDVNNPPPGPIADFVTTVRQNHDRLQNDQRFEQHQKTDYLQAMVMMLQIAAKPNKTPEDVAEFRRLGGVQRPELPAPAQSLPTLPRPGSVSGLPSLGMGAY